jgi:hypothetical protein
VVAYVDIREMYIINENGIPETLTSDQIKQRARGKK